MFMNPNKHLKLKSNNKIKTFNKKSKFHAKYATLNKKFKTIKKKE